MLNDAALMAFVATANPERAKRFYAETLGLPLLADEPYALVFDCNGITLRVQKTDAVAPPPYMALGWKVPDLAGVLATLVERGVTFVRYPFLEQDARGIWTTPDGSLVAWFQDPDGNLLSLTQLASPRPGR
jgi:catechol 2,3-dioxygenase-like lactoylglutathione lyase family enzyme